MKDFFTEKYGGSVGRILDTWAANPLNKEIGDIYEKNVFGQEAIDVREILEEYVGQTTGGQVSYNGRIKK
jgi:hypothetical protein